MTLKSETPRTLCDEVVNLIPAYAFGATDPEETRFVEQHLNECPEAVAELSLYSEIHDGMLFEAPLVAAPPELARRVAAIPKSPKVIAVPSKPAIKKSRTYNIGWAVAAAALVLMVASNLYWFSQVRSTDDERRILAALSSGNVVETQLISTNGASSQPKGSVLWSDSQQVALLRVEALPETSQDNEYQLWLIEGENRTSAGTFRVNNQGTGVLVFEPKVPLTTLNAVGITLEPAGGSPAPTTSPLLVGEISPN